MLSDDAALCHCDIERRIVITKKYFARPAAADLRLLLLSASAEKDFLTVLPMRYARTLCLCTIKKQASK